MFNFARALAGRFRGGLGYVNVAAVGIDPVHFGVIFIFNLMIGLMTPPMGIGLFVVSGVSGIGFNRLARAAVPFLLLRIFFSAECAFGCGVSLSDAGPDKVNYGKYNVKEEQWID